LREEEIKDKKMRLLRITRQNTSKRRGGACLHHLLPRLLMLAEGRFCYHAEQEERTLQIYQRSRKLATSSPQEITHPHSPNITPLKDVCCEGASAKVAADAALEIIVLLFDIDVRRRGKTAAAIQLFAIFPVGQCLASAPVSAVSRESAGLNEGMKVAVKNSWPMTAKDTLS